MLVDNRVASWPSIDESLDNQEWTLPLFGTESTISPEAHCLVGQKSMQSTVFHWTARLAVLCRKILQVM
jgi:hypothetical protein